MTDTISGQLVIVGLTVCTTYEERPDCSFVQLIMTGLSVCTTYEDGPGCLNSVQLMRRGQTLYTIYDNRPDFTTYEDRPDCLYNQ